jgi:hypothetical protein
VVLLFFACSQVGAFLIIVHGSLTEDALEAFSGTQISPFERKQILLGCRNTDITEGGWPFTETHYDQRFHFDNAGSYREVLANYADLTALLDYNLRRKRRDPYEFGKILHAAEDFHSHSNYLILYTDYLRSHGDPMRGQVPPLEEVLAAPDKYPGFLPLLDAKLRTGFYPNEFAGFPAEYYHGSFVGIGMNKDSIIRPHFGEAREAALLTAKWYLHLYTGDADAKTEYAAFKTALAEERERAARSTSPEPPPSFSASAPGSPSTNPSASAPVATTPTAVTPAPLSPGPRRSSRSRHRRHPVHHRRLSGRRKNKVTA